MELRLVFSAKPEDQQVNSYYRQMLKAVNVYFGNLPRQLIRFPLNPEPLNQHYYDLIQFYGRCWSDWHKIEQYSSYWPSKFGPMPEEPGKLLRLKLQMDYDRSLRSNTPVKELDLERWCRRSIRRARRSWNR